MDWNLEEIIEKIATELDFVSFESNHMGINKQMVFYGHSSEFEAFKDLAADNFMTGTMAYLVDTKASYVYSRLHNTWY